MQSARLDDSLERDCLLLGLRARYIWCMLLQLSSTEPTFHSLGLENLSHHTPLEQGSFKRLLGMSKRVHTTFNKHKKRNLNLV